MAHCRDEMEARHTVLQQFERCASDSERLWLVDLVAPDAERWAALFIDDGLFPSSSPAAALRVASALNEYNVHSGVAFEAGQPEKSRFLADGVDSETTCMLQTALGGSIFDGSPFVVTQTQPLGNPITAAPGL